MPVCLGDSRRERFQQRRQAGYSLAEQDQRPSCCLVNGRDKFNRSVYLPTVDTAWDMVGARDLNGDGKPDIIWQNKFTGECTTWFMNGSSVTGGAGFGNCAGRMSIAGAGDFNGDAKPDIIWQNKITGQRTVWLMDGTNVTAGANFGTVNTAWQIRNH